MSSEKVIADKTAWPVNPIETYSGPTGDWGFLVIYSDGSWEFVLHEKPTEAEILDHWSHRFFKSKGVADNA